ncbi:hypothetical protein [Streptomyces rimosus]|uniref:hypothetical protein n=1 Tax=Streptomyces rimosus TaxID=1927 RepID=UPI0004CB3439|nr:hypothetical protein [Streptomyces rimosus]
MESARLNECPLHGAGLDSDHLVGQRLERIVASWHRQHRKASSCLLDVWLIGRDGIATRVTTGSDWCLIVERSTPYEGYDMGDAGRVEVAPVQDETPFTAHLGEAVLAVREEADAVTGRLALDITFESGRVRCQSWAGELRLSTR